LIFLSSSSKAKTVDQKIGGTDKSLTPLQVSQLELCAEMIIEALFAQGWETRIAEDLTLVLKHFPLKFIPRKHIKLLFLNISEKIALSRFNSFLQELNKNPKSQYAYGLDVLSNSELFLTYIKVNVFFYYLILFRQICGKYLNSFRIY
jgi:hypothetical protein